MGADPLSPITPILFPVPGPFLFPCSVNMPLLRFLLALRVHRDADVIIIARICSMTGRYCFHRCLSVNISGGTLSRSGW